MLEIATGIAGPFCAKMLAEYGAEIIKVEWPLLGDPSRHCDPDASCGFRRYGDRFGGVDFTYMSTCARRKSTVSSSQEV